MGFAQGVELGFCINDVSLIAKLAFQVLDSRNELLNLGLPGVSGSAPVFSVCTADEVKSDFFL